MEQLSPGDRAVINSLFNPLLPLGEGVDEGDPASGSTDSEDADVCPEARALNAAGVAAAEASPWAEAEASLTEAIALAPHWASPLNNRAQLYRILRRDQEAMSDLKSALELCGAESAVCRQASVQLGLLHRLHGEDELARNCFTVAAKLGSSFAKTQLVALNPMAALCNKMLVRMVADVKAGVVDQTQ